MRIAMALLMVALSFGSACKKDKKAEPTAGSTQPMGSAGTGSAAGSAPAGSAEAGSAAGSAGSAAAGSGDAAGSAAATTPMQNKGGNCPSLVSGATTKAELKGGKVLLTISAADKDAIAAIQKRTEELLKAKGDGAGDGSGTAHDQKGTHGGGLGMCPVHVQEGGKAEAKNDAAGVVITLTPKNNADAYKAEIDSRITKSAEWLKANVQEGDKGTQGGVGGGSGGHGMNHSGEGDGKGQERKGGGGAGTGGGGGMGTGGGGGKGTGGGGGKGGGEKSK
ncbi:MAG: hypothetical protein SFX73_40940 [Kofleriaceae bacterium]|nr:hypothetical protein [Kofleriaceae bacterium]